MRHRVQVFCFAVLAASTASAQPAGDKIHADFKQYKDANGLVWPTMNPPVSRGAGNGVLYLSEEMAFLVKRNAVAAGDREDFVKTIRSLQAAPGLINRNPAGPKQPKFHDDQEGPDDYIGMVAAAHMLGGPAQQLANEVAAYGDSHLWFMNNARENSSLDRSGRRNVSAIFTRFPQYIAHFHYCAGLPTDPVTEAVWAAALANGARGDSAPDSVVLEWFMVQCRPAKASPVVKAAVIKWVMNFKKNFPNGLQDVNGRMFDKSHPLVLYAPGIEDYDFQGVDAVVGTLIAILTTEGVEVLKGVTQDAELAVKLGKAVFKGDEKAALAAAKQIALAPINRAKAFAERAAQEGKQLAEVVGRTEQQWQKKLGEALFPRSKCDIERDDGYGACERAVEPANGDCDARCARCDDGIEACFNDCDSKCGQCQDADQSSCHHDCDTECDRCGDDGCRGAICNDSHLKGCHDGCNGRANAGAGCRGAWCGDGREVRGCRDGCTGRRNAAAGCRGAWCGEGEAVTACHQTQNLKRDDCKRAVEAKYAACK